MKYTDICSRDDLAIALGIERRQLTGLLYGIGIDKCYSSFEIPKKNGGKRLINAPNKSLKYVQRKLSKLLLKRLDDYNRENGSKQNIAHAYFKGKGIKTNAFPHRNKRFILNIDLDDFFGTIHFGRVQGFFQKNAYFKLPEIATILAQLTCYEGKLPQGAPTSPVISNLICQILDYKILDLCKRYKLTYTRYADDLTFSTNDRKVFESRQQFVEELGKIIEKSGFNINNEKTYFQSSENRQVVTGLSVNKKINVTVDFYKKTRSMAQHLYKTGGFSVDGKEGNLNILEGRFSFINDLVRYNNQTKKNEALVSNSPEYQKYLSLPIEKLISSNPSKRKRFTGKLTRNEKLFNLTIREKDYQKFLFYKYFVANPKTIIITEGKTDSRYIKASLKRYYTDYPNLIKKEGNKFSYNIMFLPRSQRLKYFFGFLDGGGSDLINLVSFFIDTNNCSFRNYVSYFKSIITNNPPKPVIFLLDNEEKSGKPLGNFKSFISKNIPATSSQIDSAIKSDFFYHIDFNTFLMTLPVERTSNSDILDVEIENLFDLDKINNELIKGMHGGKTFTPKKAEGDDLHIGKEIFSKTILTNYKSEIIDFSQFKPLLDNISNLSNNYSEYTKDKIQ